LRGYFFFFFWKLFFFSLFDFQQQFDSTVLITGSICLLVWLFIMGTSQPLNDLNQSDQENGPTEIFTEKAAMRPKCFSSTLQECLFVLTATMAIGQQSFFQGCIVGVTASIGSDLNMNSAEITWINAGASYVTSFISSMLITSYTTRIMHYIS